MCEALRSLVADLGENERKVLVKKLVLCQAGHHHHVCVCVSFGVKRLMFSCSTCGLPWIALCPAYLLKRGLIWLHDPPPKPQPTDDEKKEAEKGKEEDEDERRQCAWCLPLRRSKELKCYFIARWEAISPSWRQTWHWEFLAGSSVVNGVVQAEPVSKATGLELMGFSQLKGWQSFTKETKESLRKQDAGVKQWWKFNLKAHDLHQTTHTVRSIRARGVGKDEQPGPVLAQLVVKLLFLQQPKKSFLSKLLVDSSRWKRNKKWMNDKIQTQAFNL